ncbi:hypothetical protein ACLF3G_09090 [Falsiroseomonas sp. HC035]|uniref:hypothetical protein n=1 Tax=Falsiroseomonas sp. HC035 TaxID=3390999 RepID=UPI003D3110E6
MTVADDASVPPTLAASRLREAGDLPGAIALLRQAGDAPDVAHMRLRLLFEIQDYAALQQATREAIRRLDPATVVPAHHYPATLLHFAELCCLPLEEIEAVILALGAASRQHAPLRQAWYAVRHRQRFRTWLRDRFEGGASFISLGLNCLPWHLPCRWGLRREEDFVALFVPFALAGHTVPGVLAALEDDFAGYCDPGAIRIVRTRRGHSMAVRADRTAHWNHHRGPYWLQRDAAPMRDNLAAKAALFRDACRRPDAVFLLAACPVQYPEEKLDFLAHLDAALARFTGRAGNRILITNNAARQRPAELHVVDAGTCFAYCPYPAADYVWHEDAHADTPAGLAFERTYADQVTRALTKWGLMRRKPGAAA